MTAAAKSALYVTLLGAFIARAALAASVEYDREIRPIFSDNCYQCHGPDEKARKAKLRLDVKESAFRVQDGVAVIKPGKSAESELVRRITTTDTDDLMPPPRSNHKLTPKQIELIKQWIDSGAKWSQHWAFSPIQSPKLPAVKDSHWPANEIDRFILARLEQEKLSPSPQADRERLIRRITFDLTGFPPTLAEIDAFLADKSANAYEKVVDRLLQSSRYGERMATVWLDLARYADTYGYQMDAPRPMWPYRDWVIKVFNQNLPFDQFITWQIAGDLLPNATKEQRLATAFNRLHLQNEEGGVVDEEFRVAYVDDRVDTFGTAFLGLTLQCAHCHDHKFDPITMKDFYSLFAMFQNIDESGQNPYSQFVNDMPAPTLLLSDEATDARLVKLSRQIAKREEDVLALRESARGSFSEWLKSNHSTPSVQGLVAAFSFDQITEKNSTNSVDSSKPAHAHEDPKPVEGKFGQAAELDGENGFSFPGIGNFTRTDPFSIALWIETASHSDRQLILHHSKAPADAGSRGYELLLENGCLAVGLHHQWPGNSIKVRCKSAIPTNEWVHVAFTYDGSSHASGLRIFINGKPAEVEVIRDHLWKDITYDSGEPELAIGYRFRDSGFKNGKVDDFRVFNRALTAIEVADVAGLDDLRTAHDGDALLDYYIANFYPPARQLTSELKMLRREQSRLINPIPEIEVMEEMPQPKPAYILKRGAYDQHGEQVSANTPAVLPPLPADAPRNRLSLARWLTAPSNPLLARVTVNRAWEMMFGRGIVETVDNFGSRGAVPTHPELLDWLASDFIHSSWDYKALLKKIAMSATYRQSSKTSAELLARDPENNLLARGPTRRLTAEMLRDQALADSGLLAEKIGGPSVKPYQPPGLWEIAMGNPRYEQGHGDELHRRSLYTFWKRTVPPPSMVAFDAAERNVCLAKRQSTSTPLQALSLLNDVQMTEAARLISQRMLQEGGSTLEARIVWAFRLVTSRHPSNDEIKVLEQLFKEQRELFAADQQSASKLLAEGETSNSPALSPIDLAAGTVLAEALLNHDEAIMRR
jgi:mono/diheme cytochrome c family protein